jgi:hypothetical protein
VGGGKLNPGPSLIPNDSRMLREIELGKEEEQKGENSDECLIELKSLQVSSSSS